MARQQEELPVTSHAILRPADDDQHAPRAARHERLCVRRSSRAALAYRMNSRKPSPAARKSERGAAIARVVWRTIGRARWPFDCLRPVRIGGQGPNLCD